MTGEEKENQAKTQVDEQPIAPTDAENATAEDFPPELREPLWSVVSFEKCEAGGLNYAEAEQKLSELDAQKIPGLCIVTDEAAARMTTKK